MALVLYEPFEFWPIDCYATDIQAWCRPYINPSGVTGMDGRCLAIGINSVDGRYVEWELPTSLATVYMSFLYRPTYDYTYGNEIFTFKNSSGTIQGLLGRGSDSKIYAYRGWGAASLGSSTVTVPVNTTVLISVKYKPHDTEGIFQVWINGSLQIDITTGDTTDASGNVSRFRFGEQGGHTDMPYGYYDCIAVDDAEIPGLIKCKVLLPVTGGGYIGEFSMLPNTGEAPWQDVDEKGRTESGEISLTDGLYGDEADLIHALPLAAMDGTNVDSIVGVKAVAIGVVDNYPIPQKQQVGIRSGGTNYFSGSFNLPMRSGPRQVQKLWLLDPYDDDTWTIDKIDALEILAKLVA